MSNNNLKNTDKSVDILLLNVQSIRNKINEFEVFLESLNYPSIILLTEHWLQPNESCYIQNYLTVSVYSRQNSLHGGTMILINYEFFYSFQFSNITKYDSLLCEGIFEFSIIYNKTNNLCIICIYRPPSGNMTEFLVRLESLLCQLPVSCRIALAGDFNVNYVENESTNTRNLKSLLGSFDLRMIVKEPTRISRFSKTVIDYVCTNFLEEDYYDVSVLPSGLSDHEAVLLTTSLNFTSKKPVKHGRIYSRSNFRKFILKAEAINWHIILNNSDPLSRFSYLLIDIFNECFPLCKIRQKSEKPWITKGIKVSSKNLRCLHTLGKFFGDEFLLIHFKKYRKIYRQLIKLAKESYYKERINNSSNKCRENWKIINNLRGKPNSRVKEVRVDSNILNTFYCSMAEQLTSTLQPQCDPLIYLQDVSVADSFYFRHTNIDELKEIFRDIKNKNSSGIDDISVRIFEVLPECALNVLVKAINISFDQGSFPDILKTSIVTPLFKGGDLDNPADYRPVSLLPTSSKIIEKLVKNRAVSFLNRHKLLSESQFGFQTSKNTGDAIFSFLEKLYLSLNDGEVAAAVFCDFSKAFDCVNHRVLLGKLHRYGFRGCALRWFSSYLSNRKQVVKSQGKDSSSLNICHGVPQGSVLGPLLFLVYANDIASINIRGRFTLFADDTTILWVGKDSTELRTIIEQDLCEVKKWCDANFLCFNVTKTNILTFKCLIDNVHLNNIILENKASVKFLGLHIDEKLKFRDHIFTLNGKLASGCFAVRVVSGELGFSAARSVYFSLIESHLRYGIAFWGFCSQQLFCSVFIYLFLVNSIMLINYNCV